MQAHTWTILEPSIIYLSTVYKANRRPGGGTKITDFVCWLVGSAPLLSHLSAEVQHRTEHDSFSSEQFLERTWKEQERIIRATVELLFLWQQHCWYPWGFPSCSSLTQIKTHHRENPWLSDGSGVVADLHYNLNKQRKSEFGVWWKNKTFTNLKAVKSSIH